MKFKENLRYLRRSRNMSQDELANILGYKSFTTVQKWEDGTSFPVVLNLNKLSKLFGVELDDLLNADLTTKKIAVPILGEVKAGYNKLADENILGYEYLNNSEYKAGEYFYLKVIGDSMIGNRIADGDLVYVKKQNYLNKSDIGVFLINDNEVTIKKYDPKSNYVVLKASNEKYEDHKYKYDDIKILGKVIHIKINL